jgi:hypothetical protein
MWIAPRACALGSACGGAANCIPCSSLVDLGWCKHKLRARHMAAADAFCALTLLAASQHQATLAASKPASVAQGDGTRRQSAARRAANCAPCWPRIQRSCAAETIARAQLLVLGHDLPVREGAACYGGDGRIGGWRGPVAVSRWRAACGLLACRRRRVMWGTSSAERWRLREVACKQRALAHAPFNLDGRPLTSFVAATSLNPSPRCLSASLFLGCSCLRPSLSSRSQYVSCRASDAGLHLGSQQQAQARGTPQP